MWEIEYTEEFEAWWDKCSAMAQTDIDAIIKLLERNGPHLEFPFSSGINGSKYKHMRELRIQHKGDPYRILYAFAPNRVAILLIGGCKTGHDRWYVKHIKIADALYETYLIETYEER